MPKPQELYDIGLEPSIYLFHLRDAFSPQWEVPGVVVGYTSLGLQDGSLNLIVNLGRGCDLLTELPS